jgi:hypothetical protein
MHRLLVLLAALVFGLIPTLGDAEERQITDVKELAGQWQGWVTSQLGGQQRAMMTIKEDGSYESSTIGIGSTITVGNYYLDGGRVRYRSSRTEGSVTVSEEKGTTTIRLSPEGTYSYVTGPAEFERLK